MNFWRYSILLISCIIAINSIVYAQNSIVSSRSFTPFSLTQLYEKAERDIAIIDLDNFIIRLKKSVDERVTLYISDIFNPRLVQYSGAKPVVDEALDVEDNDNNSIINVDIVNDITIQSAPSSLEDSVQEIVFNRDAFRAQSQVNKQIVQDYATAIRTNAIQSDNELLSTINIKKVYKYTLCAVYEPLPHCTIQSPIRFLINEQEYPTIMWKDSEDTIFFGFLDPSSVIWEDTSDTISFGIRIVDDGNDMSTQIDALYQNDFSLDSVHNETIQVYMASLQKITMAEDLLFALLNDTEIPIGLYNDIVMPLEYLPIGYGSLMHTFNGFFTGNGHTIYMEHSPLSLQQNTALVYALLWDIGENASVVDLTIEMRGENTAYVIAPIAIHNQGRLKNITIANAHVNVGIYGAGAVLRQYTSGRMIAVRVSAVIEQQRFAHTIGGLVAYNHGGRIERSNFEGRIVGGQYTGGLIGRDMQGILRNISYVSVSIMSDQYAGLIIGEAKLSVIDTIAVRGYVEGRTKLGGLIGSMSDSVINHARVSAIIKGEKILGGIVGQVYNSHIKDVHFTGNVLGYSIIGGIVGELHSGSVMDSSAQIRSGYADYMGGIIGVNAGTVARTFSMIQIGVGTAVGGLVGYNTGHIENSYSRGAVVFKKPLIVDGVLLLEYETDARMQIIENGIGGIVGININGATTYDGYTQVVIPSEGQNYALNAIGIQQGDIRALYVDAAATSVLGNMHMLNQYIEHRAILLPNFLTKLQYGTYAEAPWVWQKNGLWPYLYWE